MIGEHHARKGTWPDPSQFDDADALQWSGHGLSFSFAAIQPRATVASTIALNGLAGLRRTGTVEGGMTVIIWHNPKCGTSRNALAMIRATGIEPDVLLYLETPPTAAALAQVAAALGGARALLRLKGTPASEMGLETASDETILAAMLAEPVLINRPVVIGPRGIVLARPSERAIEVLDGKLPASFLKEDGTSVVH
jgi:arsenate reductase